MKPVPKSVRELPLGQRMRWARIRAGLSHDRLVEKMGRSDRSHLIKIEKGVVSNPRPELRDAWADACGVPRDLFAPDEAEERAVDLDTALRSYVRKLIREEVNA